MITKLMPFIVPFCLLTIFLLIGFLSLIDNVIRTIRTKLDVTYTEIIQAKQENHMHGVAILFLLTFLAWLIFAGLILGKFLIAKALANGFAF